MTIDRINTRGSHYEIGVQQGRQYYSLVGRISMTKMLRGMNFVQSTNIATQVGKSVFNFVFDQLISGGARKMEKSIKSILPNQYDKLEGIAEGFGLKTDKLAKALYFENFSVKLDIDTKVPRRQGCTAGIVVNRKNQGYLTKNFDFPSELEKFQILRFNDLTSNEYSSVGLGEGPMPGCVSGINEKGLAITMNSAYSKDTNLSNPPGTMFCQEVLDTLKTTDEAVEFLMKAPMPGGWIFALLDKNNDGRIVERSASRSAVRPMEPIEEGSIAVATNNYLDPTTQETEIPENTEWAIKDLEGLPLVRLSKWRYVRARELFEAESKRNKITIGSLHTVMSDHKRPPNGVDESVCRHSNALFETLSTVYMNPQELKIAVSDGNPCLNNPIRKFNVSFNYDVPNIRYLRRDSEEEFYDPLF
jgi:predicted choloylglycine hydrolase